MMNRRKFGGALLGSVMLLSSARRRSVSAQTGERILVAGATGRTGRFVVTDLLKSGHIVRGLTRNPDGARERFGNDVEWVAGDVRDTSSISPLFAGVDRVISVLGATETTGANTPEAVEYNGNVNLIDLAKANQLKQVVMITSLSAGRVDQDPELARRFRGMVWKNRSEQYLRSSGVPYTIVGPGGLRDYPGGTQGIRYYAEKDIQSGVISREDVGLVMAESVRTVYAMFKTLRIVNDPGLDPSAWRQGLLNAPVD